MRCPLVACAVAEESRSPPGRQRGYCAEEEEEAKHAQEAGEEEKEEKQGEGRRTSWQSFAKKNKTTKAAKNGHDPKWDPTRDHGELAARQQMEKYSTYLAREGGS